MARWLMKTGAVSAISLFVELLNRGFGYPEVAFGRADAIGTFLRSVVVGATSCGDSQSGCELGEVVTQFDDVHRVVCLDAPEAECREFSERP